MHIKYIIIKSKYEAYVLNMLCIWFPYLINVWDFFPQFSYRLIQDFSLLWYLNEISIYYMVLIGNTVSIYWWFDIWNKLDIICFINPVRGLSSRGSFVCKIWGTVPHYCHLCLPLLLSLEVTQQWIMSLWVNAFFVFFFLLIFLNEI